MSNDKILLKYSTAQLDRIIIALLNNASNKKFVGNVKRLFGQVNDSIKLEVDKEVRLWLIKEISCCIIDKKLDDCEKILSFMDVSGKYASEAIEILNTLYEDSITENELSLLDKDISNSIKYASVIDHGTNITDAIINLQAENYENGLENAMIDFESKLDNFTRELKSARESTENARYDLSLSDSGFVKTMKNLIQNKQNTSSKVKTGLKCFNEMLGGGMERGRLYVALGMAKGWKSGFMLNAVKWAKQYNKLESQDKSLKPVIVYLSMENSNDETIDRLWASCFGNESKLDNYTELEACHLFESAGVFTPNDPTSPEILIWYRPNKSISTADLNDMLEELKKEGKECVFLVLDYLRRIAPARPSKDLRIELSDITNELKTIATEQNIPILTAGQLNRNAFETVDMAEGFDAKLRSLERLGAANISESIDIIQNADFIFILHKIMNVTLDEEGKISCTDKFLFVKLLASRGKQPEITSFKHRFRQGYDMALVEDIDMEKSQSIITDSDYVNSRESDTKTSGKRNIKR